MKAADLKTLEKVKNEFSEHSKNEENLLRSLEFGVSGGSLSALKSHSDDHSRILAMMDQTLQSGGTLSSSDIKKVVEAIYQHADRFDVLYAVDSDEFKVSNAKLGS